MHRTATFYDLKIIANGVSRAQSNQAYFDATPKTMREIVAQVEQLFKGGDQIVQKGRGAKSAKLYLSDMEIRNDKVIFLINRSDPDAPDAVSSDPDTRSRVVHSKPLGHGGDYSAHVVLKLDPFKGDNYYICVIETVFGFGLHASSISQYIKHLVRSCKKAFPDLYKIPNIDGSRTQAGQPNLVSLIHQIEFQGHPSEEFENDLKDGILSSIQLLSFTHKGGVWDDGNGAIRERVRTIELRPESGIKQNLNTTIRQVVNGVFKKDREYDHVRIKFRNIEGDSRDATIDATNGKLIDAHKYVKRHNIQAPLVNTNSFDIINNSIIREVISLME